MAAQTSSGTSNSSKLEMGLDKRTMEVQGTKQAKTSDYFSSKDDALNGVATNGVANGTSNDNVFKEFLKGMFCEVISKGLEEQSNTQGKVVEFRHPSDIQQLVDLELGESGLTDEKLYKICQPIIKYSVKTGHPHFFNQLWQGLDRYALAGMWLTDTLNTSQYTFEVAPVFTMMEEVVFKKLRSYVGWDKGDAIFCPGGSVANMYGLNVARFHKYPEVKTKGMQGIPKICAFTSEHAHYSMKKGVGLLGIGIDNLFAVKCDDKGRMIPSELEATILKAKHEGYAPFLVNGTSGTTVFGAYDPIDEIADVCNKYNTWLHVDACWGGGALLSRQHRHKLKGLHRADSVAWNPHKMMGSLLQTCAFLTKHENLLTRAHCANAVYLFQQDKVYDVSFDTGDKSIQCGRKVDVLKIWFMWKARGDAGLEQRIDNIFSCAKHLTDKIRQADGFRLVLDQPECSNVCFWYIPPSLRGQEETDEWRAKLGKVAPAIKGRMQMEGTMLIGYQPQANFVNFFRFVLANADVTTHNMDFVVNEIQRVGKDL